MTATFAGVTETSVIFAVKMRDTESAARAILPLIGPDTGVISLQNGVVKDDILRPIIGA